MDRSISCIITFLQFTVIIIQRSNYNIADSLPATLNSNVSIKKVKDDFGTSNMHIVMMDKNMSAKDKQQMFKKIDKVKGVKWTISMSSLIGPSVPDSMIPKDVRKMMQSKDYELAFVSTKYESATDPVNTQIKKIDKIVKSYDKSGMVIGEAPLMKDLQDVTDVDLVNVNIISIAAIFVIILIIFKSISLPGHPGGSYRICNYDQHGDPVLSGNQPSICGKYRDRCHSVRCNC